MDGISFKSLEKLIIELQHGVDKINKGTLPSEEFSSLLNSSRLLNERLAILQYLTEKNENNQITEFNSSDESVEKNQINLLDAIVEVEDNFEKNDEKSNKELGNIKEEKSKVSQSVNDLHASTPQTSLADQFGQQPIKDLTKEIGINERFLLTENLFNGNSDAYRDAINELNNFSSLEDALKCFKQDIAKKLNWSLKNNHVKRFIKLVQRRYQ